MTRPIVAASKAILSRRRVSQVHLESLENRQLLSLAIDLRLPGGGKSATVSSVGQTINFEIWATVKGKNSSTSDEGLQIVSGSLLSTNVSGGAANGTIKTVNASPFDGLGSQIGTQRDLDGDGDQDVGSNDNTDGSSMFAARSPGITAGSSFKIGTGTFTVTSLKSGGQTNLQWKTRNYSLASLWREDGSLALKSNGNGTFLVGAPIVLKRTGSRGGGATGGGSTASISGLVYSDNNRNGRFDTGDTRLANRRMFLDNNHNGRLDSGEKSTLSNSSGVYTFSNLAAGSYRVRRADTPSNYTFSNPSSGFYDLALANGQKIGGKDFGAILKSGGGNTGGGGGTAAKGSISGIVFSDNNRNGRFDTGDTRLANRRMYVDANHNGRRDSSEKSVTSNGSGVYTFGGLAAGKYRIRRDMPAGYKLSTPSIGYYDLTLATGQSITRKDFGAIVA